MIIISDCLTAKVDEGCLKVANTLTKKIKDENKNNLIISYDRKASFSDIHLNLNKLFLNKSLISIINKKNNSILYIPFASNTTWSALRIFILSIFSRKKVNVIFALRHKMNFIGKKLLNISNANIIALSEESYRFYSSIIANKAYYLKTGVDTDKFIPVDRKQKIKLRNKYEISEKQKIVLHVGHLKSGRNIDKLVNIDAKYHVLLVISSETEQDLKIREKLEERSNITIIDTYIEKIEEIYQIADIYLFPVEEAENCIDIPLSVLEAASCNIPILTTKYGELKSFIGKEGFTFIDEYKDFIVNQKINKIINMNNVNTRNSVIDYDWNESVKKLNKITKSKE